MPTIAIRTTPAQPIWFGSPEDPKPVTIANVSATANIWIGNNVGVYVGDSVDCTVIPPGGYLSLDGTDSYWVVADAPNAQVAFYPGVTSFFLPANLVTLGGVKIFNQSTAPTQPPTIPVNSLWFDSSGGIWVWNGSAWVAQSFSGSAIITANTITASQLAAGIVYAGIVDGTLITGANIQFANGWLSNGDGTFTNQPGLFLYNGTPAANNLFSSTTNAAGTDKFGNKFLGGHTDYRQTASGYVAVSIVPSTGTGQIAWYTAITMAGGWTFSGGLDAYGIPQVVSGNDQQTYVYGHRAQIVGVNTLINSTTPIALVTFANVAPGYYVVRGKVRFTSAASGTIQPMDIRFLGTSTCSAIEICTNITQELAAVAQNPSIITAQNQSPGISPNLGNNQAFRWEFDGIIHVSGAGSWQLAARQGLSAADETFTVTANSWMRLEPVGN